MITMNDPLNKPKVIDSFFQKNQKSMISIHYHYTNRLGVGTKLSNLHGQKGIVSAVKDLSRHKFWTRDGKLVHPQLLFSKQSLVGRTTSSQTLSMLNSPDLAIGENGEVAAPLSFFVHQIEAYAKCKQMLPKNDLMTAENGFTANGLIASMNLMSKQYPLNETVKENSFVLDLLKLGHVHVSINPSEESLRRADNADREPEKKTATKRKNVDESTIVRKKIKKEKDLEEERITEMIGSVAATSDSDSTIYFTEDENEENDDEDEEDVELSASEESSVDEEDEPEGDEDEDDE